MIFSNSITLSQDKIQFMLFWNTKELRILVLHFLVLWLQN